MPFMNESIPLTSLTLPAGAVSGARIVLDGTTDTIQMFDAANHLVVQLDPTGLIAGNDLSNLATANFARLNVKDSFLGNPGIEIQPGSSFAGNWNPAAFNTFLFNAGTPAEQQELTILAPQVAAHPTLNAEILLSSGAHDGTANGFIEYFGEDHHFFNHDGTTDYLEINFNGDVINHVIGAGFSFAEGSNAKMGTGTLVAGSLTVANTVVDNNSRIFLTCQTPGGTPGALRVDSRVSNTSFTVKSSSGTDTSTFAYLVIQPS